VSCGVGQFDDAVTLQVASLFLDCAAGHAGQGASSAWVRQSGSSSRRPGSRRPMVSDSSTSPGQAAGRRQDVVGAATVGITQPFGDHLGHREMRVGLGAQEPWNT
jgi:hypothetical protein